MAEPPVDPAEHLPQGKSTISRLWRSAATKMWDHGVTPQSIYRWTGPLGSSMLGKYVANRFAYLSKEDADDFLGYLGEISSATGSGEYAVN